MVRAFFLGIWAISALAGGRTVPAFFIPNQGQAPKNIRFMAKASGLSLYFSPREIAVRSHGLRLQMRFEGADPAAIIEGGNALPGRANFLIGNSSQWRRDVPLFGAISYRSLYPGIDMRYAAAGVTLKSEFVIAPGGDPSRIHIRYSGAVPSVQPDGSLSLAAGPERLTEAIPDAYQENGGRRIAIACRYTVRGTSVGFALGEYDPSQPLIIDPLLSYSMVIGTRDFNAATAIAVDSTGSAYIAGYTDSHALPTANPAQNFNRGSVAAFVAKLNPAGDSLLYCTYMGGSNDDRAYGIAVDSSGSAYVTGTTTSWDFPTLHAEQSYLSGSRNAFVFKLNPMGNLLVFSTFLGGSGADTAYGIAVDSSGNSYVVGDTTSPNFPVTGFQSSNAGLQDAFVAKLSSTGEQLLFSTYLGGAGADHGGAIAIDPTGTAYITGYTSSANFPVRNPYQRYIAGACNSYIARLNTAGSDLLFSTYFGGSGCTMAYPETGQAIAVDSQGNAYIAGVTSSSDFPVRNAIQPNLQGSSDVFAAKVTSIGGLLFSTYLGGSGVDVGNAIAVDPSGSIYVAGYTYSTDFPVTVPAVQADNAGGCDAFLFKLSPAGDTLLYATYLGGSGSDTASAIALDSRGNVYLAGWTLSTNFPVVN